MISHQFHYIIFTIIVRNLLTRFADLIFFAKILILIKSVDINLYIFNNAKVHNPPFKLFIYNNII